VEKTEAGYRQVQNLLTKMRREESLPWDWIADNTRWMRKPATYDSLHQALIERMASMAVEAEQDAYSMLKVHDDTEEVDRKKSDLIRFRTPCPDVFMALLEVVMKPTVPHFRVR